MVQRNGKARDGSVRSLERGLALRSIGDTMALMPPLIISAPELDEMFALTRAALDATAEALLVAQ